MRKTTINNYGNTVNRNVENMRFYVIARHNKTSYRKIDRKQFFSILEKTVYYIFAARKQIAQHIQVYSLVA